MTVLDAYDALGVPYEIVHETVLIPMWDGTKMNLQENDHREDHGWFHELTHWLLASDRQRAFPDFCLGRHPEAQSHHLGWAGLNPPAKALASVKREDLGWESEPVLARSTILRQEEDASNAMAFAFVTAGEDYFGADVPKYPTAYDEFNEDPRLLNSGSTTRARRSVSRIHRDVLVPLAAVGVIPECSLQEAWAFFRRVTRSPE